MPALRPRRLASRLTDSQIRTVLSTISFPHFTPTSPLPPPTLLTLSQLHIHFLTTFPFEALSLNYEPGGSMSPHLEDIYSRFVEKRLGGGYCLQVNQLYREVLSALGFRWIGVLGRVFGGGEWSGLTHTTTLVLLDSHVDSSKKVYYVSDVGFGSSPHRPLLLRDGWEEFGRGGEKFRLAKADVHPSSILEEGDEQVDEEVLAIASSQTTWMLQTRKKADKDWENCYSFSTAECFTPDYIATNRATSHAHSVPFATTILVVRYLLHPQLVEQSDALVESDGLARELYPYHPSAVEQRTIVGDRYLVRVGDEVKVDKVIESEEERAGLLKSEFGLLKHVETHVAVEEISGKPSRLKPREEKVKEEQKSEMSGNSSQSTLDTE
ncbi:Arylamine N-acetyltransferase [Pseudozyma hubeiensis]|nr:Arylamine N-acetyltransferase [Pseudozyma hubeiensis]